MAWVSVAVGGATALLGASTASKAANAQQEATQAQIDLMTRMYEDSVARGDEQLAAQYANSLKTLNQQLGSTQQTVNQQNALASQVKNEQKSIAAGYQNDALTASQRTLNAQLGYLSPYADTGYDANQQLAVNMGLAPGQSTFQTTPGYEFMMDEAIGAVEGSAAAAGGVMSGATMDAINYTASGIADQEYDQYMAGLTDMANRGYSASTGMAQASGQAGATNQNIYANTANLNTGAVAGYGNTMNNAYATQGANNYNAYGNYGNSLNAAEQNTFNALAGINSQYSSDMANAYANMGNTEAAGYMAPYNALMGGVNTGFNMYGYMNTPNPWGTPPSGSAPPAPPPQPGYGVW
jgi:gas vesicle protein